MNLRLAAPAKLNFSLHITGKRADGYHEIESFAAFTEFGDVVELALADELHLVVEGPFSQWLGGDDANLILRAADALNRHAGTAHGAHIRLCKNIPVGAGLGGGSSDAAAALKGLMRLWKMDVSAQTLHAIAMELGSDVPVCLMRRPAWISGAGDKVEVVELGIDAAVLLVNPRIPLATADVYRGFAGPFDLSSRPLAAISTFEELARVMGETHNALEKPAINLQPVVAQILSVLRRTQGCAIARMSGSGATCYGLYNDSTQAQSASQAIEQAHPDWWVKATKVTG